MTKSYADINKQIAQLQSEAERLKRQEVAGVIGRINEAIAVYGLTAEDFTFGSKAPQKTAGAASGSGPKYLDRATGASWTGRGPRPQWLRDAVSAGKTLESYLATARSAAQAVARSPSPKTAAAGWQPSVARYSDVPGKSWSGRGPRPAWLRDALAAGKSLEDMRVGAAKMATSTVATAVDQTSTAIAAATKSTAGKKTYSDGAGRTWSGMGPKPKWLVDAMSAGNKQLENFLV